MKIAVIGTRGIPAAYSGFETLAEEISTRLVKKGHKVTVYCRPQYVSADRRIYKGINLVVLPTIRHKYLDTVVHTFLSVLHVILTDTEVIYFCNPVNSIFTIIPRLFGKKTIINVDGLEWKRRKWNALGRFVHRTAERIAVIFPNSIVTDSRLIKDYYKKQYNKETEYISYGARITGPIPPGEAMSKNGLLPRKFILYVSRLEPENNAHVVIAAYEKVKSDLPLVIVGDAPYSKKYISELKSTKDKRVKFLGGIFGDGYFELLANALLYIHGNEVGGTNPSLLQAMASGNCVIANGVNFNIEVIGDSGVWFKHNDVESLAEKIQYLLDNPKEIEKYQKLAVERIRASYNWDEVVDLTENLMRRLLHGKN